MLYRELQSAEVQRLRNARQGISFVPMQEIFAGDPRLCLTILTFLPPKVASLISETVEALRRIQPEHHYYESRSMHMTVQNVRTICAPPRFSEADAQVVCEIVQSVTSRYRRQKVHVQGAIRLPASTALAVYFEEEMARMIKEIRAGLSDAGLADDKRYVNSDVPFGTITVCRFTRTPDGSLEDVLNDLREAVFGDFTVERISVVSTNAVCEPSKTHVYGTFELW